MPPRHNKRNTIERWIGFAWSSCIFGVLLGFVLMDWASFPAVKNVPLEALQLFPWLSIHPSLAIHHLYANATLLGVWELLGASLLVGKPLAEELTQILGKQTYVIVINTILFATALILRFVRS